MANKHRGEVDFVIGDKTYTLLFTVDAICQLESITGLGIVAIGDKFSDLNNVSMTLLRQIVWAGLRERHKDIDLVGAGQLIEDASDMIEFIKIIASAFSASFGDKKSSDTPRPTKPGGLNGTGPDSTRTGAAQDLSPKDSGTEPQGRSEPSLKAVANS